MAANVEAVARTRSKIHEAAIKLFTSKGFHGTGIREIAREAGVSLGNLYNHHKNKEQLFASILEELEAEYTAPGTPLDKAFRNFSGADDFEALGLASGEMVERFRDYIKLIYVDVVELSGVHIRRLYGGMRERYEKRFGDQLDRLAEGGIAGEDPIGKLMTTTMVFFFYFNIRTIFGCETFFADSDEDAIRTFSKILREGMRAS